MICEDCKWIKLCCYPPDTSYSCKRYDKYEPLTNEEWFCGLSTEEKAWFLTKACESRLEACERISFWMEWLKQPHREE